METNGTKKNGHSGNGVRYKFDEFEIDSANRTLFRSGEAVPLTGKVFDVLLVFAENPGRLLEKDELLQKVWHSGFVEEGNLARNVSTLRKALRDTGREYKYIATVQGRGYRFVTPVLCVGNGRAGSYPAIAEHTKKGDTRTRWLVGVTIAFCGLALAVGILFGFFGTKPGSSFAFERRELVRLSQRGTISPDGRYIAAITDDFRLAIHQIDTGSVLPLLPSSPHTSFWALTFSPDNNILYYIQAERNSGIGILYRIPTLGGKPMRLIDGVNGGLIVSPDGERLAFVRRDTATGKNAIVIANNDGANEGILAQFASNQSVLSLDWAPDDLSLAYVLKTREVDREFWTVEEISVNGDPMGRIGERSPAQIRTVKWMPDKSGFIMNAVDATTGLGQIWYMAYPDGNTRRITHDLNEYSYISLPADGKSIMAQQIRSPRQMWILPEGDTSRAYQLRPDRGLDQHFETVVWTPDGQLVFDSNEGGTYHIWRMRPDGTDAQQLTTGPGTDMFPTVSPDGQTIVFVSRRTGTRQLWRMDIEGRNLVQLTNFEFDPWVPGFSPDGQSVVFKAYGRGKTRLWVVSIKGGEVREFLDADVGYWSISPDGKYLAYNYFDEHLKKQPVRLHPLDAGIEERTLDIHPETWMEWSNDGRAIFLNYAEDLKKNIWRKPVDNSPAKAVTKFTDSQIFKFSFSHDGRDLACIRYSVSMDSILIRSLE